MAPPRDSLRSKGVSDGAHNDTTPVLIVGGGPVGLLQALLLSRLGVKSLIIERHHKRLEAPKAHAINPRSLEILRQYGLGEERIRQLGTPRADAFWVNFVTSLGGDAVGRLPYERMDAAVLDDTPQMIHNIAQPVLEQELTAQIAKDPNITFRKGYSIHALEQTANEVVATIEEGSSGRLYCTRARHVVGCDGRKSRVRELLGIASEGESSEQTMMTIHFKAPLRQVVGDRVGMLYWIMDPAAAGFIIAYDLDGTQIHISEVDVGRQPVESWTEEMCRAKICHAIGQDIPFDILSFRPWIFRRQIANTFQKGKVFLAGDAAHSFPPTGGLGLNCGMADAHNLAYKIALVHRGVANPSILSTYTAERRNVATIYSKQSVKNGRQIFALLRSLNMNGIVDPVEARRNMMVALGDPRQRARVDEGIEGQREHFDNLELHIGFIYGASKAPPHASHYNPKFVPGARLPHAWIAFSHAHPGMNGADFSALTGLKPVDVSYVIELGDDEMLARQWSTLDLCGPDSWTIFIRRDESKSRFWSFQKHCDSIGVHSRIWCLGEDFNVVRQPWFSEGLAGGGLLVRPDQHILLKVTKTTSGDDMITALHNYLGNF